MTSVYFVLVRMTMKTHFFDEFEILIDNVQEMEEIRYYSIC